MEGFFFNLSFNSWSTKSREEQNIRAQRNVYGKAYLKNSKHFSTVLTLRRKPYSQSLAQKVKAEFLPNVQQRLGCATGNKTHFLFKGLGGGRPVMVYLRRLCVSSQLLFFWTFSLCVCIVAAAAPLTVTNQEVECTDRIQSSSRPPTTRWPQLKHTYNQSG